MKRKVLYTLVKRTSKSQVGEQTVIERTWPDGKDKASTDTTIGTITRASGEDFVALKSDGTKLGTFKTRSKAGHAIQRAVSGKAKKTTSTTIKTTAAPAVDGKRAVTFDEALNILGAPNMAALKKRISRGTVETAEVDGKTMVMVPA